MKRYLLALLILTGGVPALAATPDLDTMWQIIQDQQREIDALKDALVRHRAENEQLRSVVEVHAARLVETEQIADAIAASPAASHAGNRVSIGGYGELHYGDLDTGEEIDFHRFVLFFGHQFAENLSFYSELEVEHAFAAQDGPGEVELEQAFVQWDYAPNHSAKVGVFLLPVGLLNETHEPNTFYGVERNAVEAQIIPSTWWEGGVALSGEFTPGWGYDLAVHSGLSLEPNSASIRSARQKVAEANGDALAYTARLRYNGVPGLQWNASLQYQADLTQGENAGTGKIDGTLLETNVRYERGAFGLRALYARWDLADEITLLSPGADEQVGWYIEPSLRVRDNVGIFARYGSFDVTAGGGGANNERTQFDVGVNYWLHENVVLKFDYQQQDNDAAADVDGFHLGFGYSF